MTNPKGIQAVATVDGSGKRHLTAGKPWKVKARRAPSGWTAELQIPFNSIPLDSQKENIVGVQFLRHLSYTNEEVQGPAVSSYGTPPPADYQKLLLAKGQ